MSDYRELNRRSWDERVPAHAASPDYKLEWFERDPAFISDVVRFDVPRLGDVSGLRGVHLQCHIGTDTVSLARLGARMSGLDFSGPAIAQARSFADTLGLEIDFHQADVYDAVEVLGAAAYDLVFTGIGALGWLPSIDRWARTVSGLLKPGGRLFLREGHPMLWAVSGDRGPDLLTVDHPYFETEEPMVWDEGGTYVQTEVEFQHNVTHEWNHGLGEIVTALLSHGLELTALEEHDSVPWPALPGQMTQDEDFGEWRLTDRPERLACSYTLQALKR
ncbi:Methyltransferase type 12 [Kribbella flavida DSM 17836]|uniref:Methyltransferase type 12 n=1 Tax=Kribbella flavida (strain DSM 17836 / JCM 10339 / NBRC 14399) TaxID=479435 RepID=D2PRV4_KRIFD|nr:class I SAM-dependent methyltransferase [Kribbella flavida]ADB29284.1 Methyltransferase type 12 [Kribbella flavida DSM 17836]